ncbi:hypothetical protein CDD82_3496 [Ophiocordyceps australis]|uniref:Calcium-channel protein CCH1 n=1 Tax=Ophiocordyceps australis TaxID=1399860 RepID=A0A2C5ZDG8_9HYPO|nr:hypothetical protein CDD82_3496 [Ophiocordyceps australis]
MSSTSPQQALGGSHSRRRHSIPLQDLLAPAASNEPGQSRRHDAGSSDAPGISPGISWTSPFSPSVDGPVPGSPIDPTALQSALPLELWQSAARHSLPSASASASASVDFSSPNGNDTPIQDFPDSDRIPLTSGAQPISGAPAADSNGFRPPMSRSASDMANTSSPRNTKGLEPGFGFARRRSFGMTLNPHGYHHPLSRSSSTSGALHRAGSIVRAMSQRVVNISGESESTEQRTSHDASMSHSRPGSRHDHDRSPAVSMLLDTSYQPQKFASTEKTPDVEQVHLHSPQFPAAGGPPSNPFRGHTLGFFSPNSRIRLKLCDVLVHPFTEPILLLLIVLQAILLAIESGPSVFSKGHERPERWGQRPIDWAMLGLFIVFTLELFARTIVSGFFLNAAEYSTIDRKKGVRTVITEQYRALFQPEQHKWVGGDQQSAPSQQQSAFTRSFTTIMQGQQALPKTVDEQQRYQLARRALLRHSFNRLDFIAVVSYWIDFALGLTGIEHRFHIYVFKMLSCLRILRLLALTNGTAIILRSLKKAAPLLVRVAFLISFFWLLFAIIGVQSFKSSLSRQCVWLDPHDPDNFTASYTNQMEFCGGYLDNDTGKVKPWVRSEEPESLDNLINGTVNGKGFICPRGSLCLQQSSPFNGTVSFDNILHSLELVFVVMSGNTFSDLMYYTMGSDYLQAALFFGGGIMIMTLWLTNLLIAVITSSFQVIRDESKSSAFTADAETSAQIAPGQRSQRLSRLQRIYNKTVPLWVLVITFGLLCQSFRSSVMSESREHFINTAEVVVTLLLDIEILIRLAANPRRFHRSWRNAFDFGLAVVTTIILIPQIRQTRAYPWLTAFQIIRVYRIVMAVSLTRKLILLVLGNSSGIANLMLFVFLMTFLVAILASQLFRGELQMEDDGKFRHISFFSIFNSFLGMYQILSSENWTEILYSVTANTKHYQTAWIGAVFLIGWFILSFFILVNMFVAVIQENFDVSEDEKRLEQVRAFLQRKELGHSQSNLSLSTIFNLGRSRRRKDPLDHGPAMAEMLLKDAVVRDFLDDDGASTPQISGRVAPQRSATTLFGPDVKPGFLSTIWGKIVHRISNREPNPFYSNIRFEANDTFDPRQMARQAVLATSTRRKAQREYLARHPRYNDALYIFRPKNPLRRFCQRLVGPARGFERFDGVEPNKIAWYALSVLIYAVVVVMVVLACVTTPLYQKEYREKHPESMWNWYVWTDTAFAAIFTVEAMVKMIADGLIWTPNAYLRSSWGIIDAVVLVTLWINVVTLLINDGAISRAVGAFKALRALRLLNVSDSARDTFHSLIIDGWWKLLGAAFVSLSLLIPFAIYGLNLFNGLLLSCNDSKGISALNSCFGEYDSSPFKDDWKVVAPRVVSNPYFNFDNFGSSLFTLFQITSQEGWTDVSFAVQSIVGRDEQPSDLAAQGNALFFVVFNLMATVFILTLFISVFMRNYTELTGVAFLTTEQRSWMELRKLLRHISPSKSSYKETQKAWKRWCHRRAIEKRGKWYRTITAFLVLHLLLLVTEFRAEPTWWIITRVMIFLMLILIYLANIVIRIIGLGWARFRRSSWDLYALVTVSGAFIATVALLSANPGGETYVQLHKIFLVAILLLLIPRNDALDQLFKTAAASLTVIGNLLATWLVFFLVFAIAMTQAFSLTRFGGEETNNLNFRSVPKALILLFRMSLGEGWNQIMEDFANIEPPLCVEQDKFFDSDCGSKVWARFLFVSWNIVSMYIFVNLFVSLMYESFSYVYQRSSNVAVVDRDEIRRFKEAWRSVDPSGTGFISREAFPRLLGELSGVFQMRIYQPEDSVRQILDHVRSDEPTRRHMSMASASALGDVDIGKLNRRLALLDVAKIRERRRRFKVFYGEVLVTADPVKGVAFSDVLMILAHYNIINDSKSLKLDEFLRRRRRLQRVDDEIRRNVVQGFFHTLYWSRKFQRHMELKRASRISAVPQMSVPEIFVNDDGETHDDGGNPFKAEDGSLTRWTQLSVREESESRGRDLAKQQRLKQQQDAQQQHPLSQPRSSLMRQDTATSGFSFELDEAEDD